MHVEIWPIDQVKPYERNPRLNDSAVDAVAASLREFGWRQPVVVDSEGVIIVGHTRWRAAKKLGLKEVPVHIASDLTPEQAKAYRLADNQTATFAEWDFDLLPLELAELQEANFDLGLLGFDQDTLAELLAPAVNEGLTDPDDVPEPPAIPTTQLGDLWLLGEHRLLCGDSTKAEDVARLLDGRKPSLMVTDPPYGVNYDPAWRAEVGINNNTQKLGQVTNDSTADWTEAWQLFEGDVAYVWHAGIYSSVVHASLKAGGFEVRSQIIWAKERFALSRGHYHWQHEPCWYSVRSGRNGQWGGDRSQSTLWKIPAREDSGLGHGTQKPLECMARPIRNHGKIGDAVYDPFLGSGTTIIAAEQLRRPCYGLEIDPAYCDVIVQRYERFTGRQAKRIAAEVRS